MEVHHCVQHMTSSFANSKDEAWGEASRGTQHTSPGQTRYELVFISSQKKDGEAKKKKNAVWGYCIMSSVGS
jgi:hypothetical protein